MNKNRKKNRETESTAEAKLKGFLDMIAPSVIQFYTDHYICGNTYRSVWALREYPTATDEQAILRHLGEKDGVTLRIYTRQVTPAGEKDYQQCSQQEPHEAGKHGKLAGNGYRSKQLTGRDYHYCHYAQKQGTTASCGCVYRIVCPRLG